MPDNIPWDKKETDGERLIDGGTKYGEPQTYGQFSMPEVVSEIQGSKKYGLNKPRRVFIVGDIKRDQHQ